MTYSCLHTPKLVSILPGNLKLKREDGLFIRTTDWSTTNSCWWLLREAVSIVSRYVVPGRLPLVKWIATGPLKCELLLRAYIREIYSTPEYHTSLNLPARFPDKFTPGLQSRFPQGLSFPWTFRVTSLVCSLSLPILFSGCQELNTFKCNGHWRTWVKEALQGEREGPREIYAVDRGALNKQSIQNRYVF